jgi:hypothetical protein
MFPYVCGIKALFRRIAHQWPFDRFLVESTSNFAKMRQLLPTIPRTSSRATIHVARRHSFSVGGSQLLRYASLSFNPGCESSGSRCEGGMSVLTSDAETRSEETLSVRAAPLSGIAWDANRRLTYVGRVSTESTNHLCNLVLMSNGVFRIQLRIVILVPNISTRDRFGTAA